KELKSKLNANEYDFIIKSRDNKICNPRNLSMNFTKSINKYTKSLEEKKKESSKYDSKNYMQLKQISFHSLRHTHATLLIFNGENIKVVSDRLGHKDISVTLNTYTHIMEDMKKGTASLLDSIFKL
ncbi:MAG: tyrosine-type recombinase/integrase, partial [Clostridium perfringens]|nr:tyrosine-type recombinase/integrase [Clostridium perfringens]